MLSLVEEKNQVLENIFEGGENFLGRFLGRIE